jgi:hypothetical protein
MSTLVPNYFFSAVLAGIWGLFEYYLRTAHKFFVKARLQALRVYHFSPENDGRLIVLTGELTASTPGITDTDLQLSFSGLYLEREVEMYQWSQIETRRTGTQIEVHYQAQWSSSSLNDTLHSGFYKNPRWHPALVNSKSWVNESHLTVCGINIDRSLVRSLRHKKLRVHPKEIELKPQYQAEGLLSYVSSNEIYFSPRVKLNLAYTPEVGDYRVRYHLVPDRLVVTLIGCQRDTDVIPWHGSLLGLEAGCLTNDEIIAKKEIGWARWLGRSLLVGGLIYSVSAKL